MSNIPIVPDAILTDSRWPEAVRVLRLDQVDEYYVTIHAIGIGTGPRIFDFIL